MDQPAKAPNSPLDSQLREMGNTKVNGLHLFAPNLITIYSLVIYYIGLLTYFFYPVIGLLIALGGGLLDSVDGWMARVLKRRLHEPPDEWGDMDGVVSATVTEEGKTERKVLGHGIRGYGAKLWLELTYPGSTNLGKSWDPLADKIKFIPTMVIFSYFGGLYWWLVAVIFVPEIIGTLMRRPFPLLKKWAHGTGATLPGKIKVYAQWLAVATSLPFHQEMLSVESDWVYVPNGFLCVAILLAIASVVSRWGKEKKSSSVKTTADREEVSDV